MSTNRYIIHKNHPPTIEGEEVVLVVVWGPPASGKTTWINEAREADEANGLAPARVVYTLADAAAQLRRGISVYLELLRDEARPTVPEHMQEIVDEIKFFGPNRLAVWRKGQQ